MNVTGTDQCENCGDIHKPPYVTSQMDTDEGIIEGSKTAQEPNPSNSAGKVELKRAIDGSCEDDHAEKQEIPIRMAGK